MAMKSDLQNTCPKCGSHDLEYEDTNICGDELGYEFTCSDCGCEGTEWYRLSFIETVADED